MKAIFADSLKRHSNVCDGCFKVIYTLGINLARQKGIKYIFTGLSRGQWLSLPLILAGLGLVAWALWRPALGSVRTPAEA